MESRERTGDVHGEGECTRRKIRLVEDNAQCRHLKNLSVKGL
jgi:hypothetical protein